MLFKKKTTPFLLLEILISLLLLSICTPSLMKSLQAQISSHREWVEEEALQEALEKIFLRAKSELDFDTLEAYFKKEESEALLYESALLLLGKELPYTLQVELMEKKSGALLLKLELSLEKGRLFSQIYCLKK